MSFYTNQSGQSFPLRERALGPPDCWEEEPAEPGEEEYDRMEDEYESVRIRPRAG